MSEQWLEVTLPVPAQELDWVCDVLTANGMAGLVVEEEGEFLRFLEQNRQYWDYVDEGLAARMKGASRVKFYVPDNQEGQRQLRQYLSGLERYEPQTISLREEDWATSWQKYYQPISVGKKIYIVPEWMRGQDVPDGRVPLYLNPGLTFGTGSHATTQLCLELLEEAVLEERGEKPERPTECAADLSVAASIPDRYVPSPEQRMDLYRRIAAIRSEADADDVMDELIDRYGDPPRTVNNLISVALLRADAARNGISQIDQKGANLNFYLDQFDLQWVSALCGLEKYRSRLLFSAGEKPYLSLRLKKGEDALKLGRKLVEEYAATGEQPDE